MKAQIGLWVSYIATIFLDFINVCKGKMYLKLSQWTQGKRYVVFKIWNAKDEMFQIWITIKLILKNI